MDEKKCVIDDDVGGEIDPLLWRKPVQLPAPATDPQGKPLRPLDAMRDVLMYYHGKFERAESESESDKYARLTLTAAKQMAPYMHATYQAINMTGQRDTKTVVLNFAGQKEGTIKEIARRVTYTAQKYE